MDDAAQEQYRHARHLIAQQRPDLAEPILRRLIGSHPDHSRSLASLAQSLLYLKRAAEGEPFAKAAIAADPSDYFAYEILARIYWSLNDPEKSYAAGKEAIAHSPSVAACYGVTGRAAMQLKRHEEALDLYQRGLAIDPDEDSCLAGATVLFARTKQFDQATKLGRQLIGNSPGSAYASYVWGSALIEMERYTEAKEILQSAVQLDPRSEFAHYWLAVAMYYLGEPAEDCRRHLNEALHLKPNLTGATEMLRRLDEEAAAARPSFWRRMARILLGTQS